VIDLMDFVAPSVKILTRGVWDEDSVVVNFDEGFAPSITDEMRIAALARFLTRLETNPNLFDGEARHLSLKRSRVDGNMLRLALGPLTYALYDMCRKEFIEAFDWEIENLPMGVGMDVVVITSDSKIVMDIRSQAVDFPGIIALPGGILDENNPFRHVRRELWEELAIECGEVGNLFLLGIAQRLARRIGIGLSFFAEVSVSAHDVTRRQPDAKEKEGEVFFLECVPEAVRNFIREKHERMVPSQVFCLIQAGCHLWGPEWSKIGAD